MSTVSFPPSRACLWDSSNVGDTLSIHLTTAGWLQFKINAIAIRVAIHQANIQSLWQQEVFFIATPIVNKNDTVVLEVNRFDPGKWVESERLIPNALLPDDIPIRCKLLKGVINTEGHLSHNIVQLNESINDIYRNLISKSNTTLLHFHHFLSLRLILFVQNESIHVISGCVLPASSIIATPIRPIPLLSTSLSSNLTGALPISIVQGQIRSGFLTMNKTRRLVPLLESDGHARTVPLIGVWISDVSISHPLVWSMLLHFSHFPSLHKVNHNGSYLLLLTRRHDYQVWEWSPERLEWAWHMTSTETLKVSDECLSSFMMPVVEGVAGHTLLTSASCQWQRKHYHDESLPLPQLNLTPNGPPTVVKRDSDLSCVSVFSLSEEKEEEEEEEERRRQSQELLLNNVYEQARGLFDDKPHQHVTNDATPTVVRKATPTITMATNNPHKSVDLSKSSIVMPKIMTPKSTVTIATNTGRSLLFNDTPTCNRSIQVCDFNKKGSGVSIATQAGSGCGSSLSPPRSLRTLSDTVSMVTGADKTMSFGSFSDGFGGVASSCYDDSECDALVDEAKRRIQSFLNASPPPLTPPTSSFTDRKYTDTSLLPFPKIQCPTDVSSIQSTDTTIDDQWSTADNISQKYLTKNIVRRPPTLLPPPPPLSPSPSANSSFAPHEFSVDTQSYLKRHGLLEVVAGEERGGSNSDYIIPNVLTDIPRPRHNISY